jgi:hypothetical protein
MKVLLLFLFPLLLFARTQPDWSYTPGGLCKDTDPTFIGYFYAEKIAKCKRDVTLQMKLEIASHYGIPREEWKNYEFDHVIQLSAGGSNSIDNIFPQPIEEAKVKDALEYEIYKDMRDGTMTQQEAINKTMEWFSDTDVNP